MGGSELIAHIRVIQVLPVADNWIDEDAGVPAFFRLAGIPENSICRTKVFQ